jgi:DNA invertase Pin-like site-specific DNA recombinase
MKVYYSRISTVEQNDERQLQNIEGFDYVFSDKCSGSIPIWERPKGKQIKKLIDTGKLTHLECHSWDRMGRDLLSTIEVYKLLTDKGITLICRNPNIRNFDGNGKPDKFSELLLGIIASMSSFEKKLIRERQMEGIAIRKQKNLYTGRQVGTVDTPERLLQKERSKQIINYLKKDTYSYQEISKILNVSPTTIVKVKKAMEKTTAVNMKMN